MKRNFKSHHLSILVGRFSFITALIFISAFFTACPEDPPQPDHRDTSIFLELEKTWITSVSLKVSVADTSSYWNFSLSRDDSAVGTYLVKSSDTIIIDTDLDPNREYLFQAYWLQDSTVQDSSNEIIVMTMDTSSHSVVWDIDTLSTLGYDLRDVTILDNDNIWVVGEIATDSGSFGAAIWNRNQWSTKKFQTSTSNVFPYGIWGFSEENIWLAAGSIYHYNGASTSLKWLRNINTSEIVRKMWGSSTNNLFFVGDESIIIHYNGATFTRMESGSTIGLTDIWGLNDDNIWIGGSVSGGPNPWGSVLLTYNNNTWEKLYEYHVPEDGFGAISMKSIWTDNEDIIYIGGESGNWSYSIKDSQLVDLENVGSWVKSKIRGFSRNDIFSVGQGSEVMHFNGISWYLYPELKAIGNGTVWWRGLAVTKDVVVIVGIDHSAEFGSYPLLVARGYR